MPHIAIIGSGFAALTAVRELRKRHVAAYITVISPRDALHYIPSSIWIPAGLRKGEALKLPLGRFFARHQVRYLAASVTGLNAERREITTDTGEVISAEHILIAAGGRFLRKLPGIENAIIPCEGIASAEAMAARLAELDGGTIAIGMATNPKEPGAIRGGPMFEYAFILDTLLRKQGRRDRFRITFFSPSPRPGQRLGEKAVDGILAEMTRRGFDTHLGHKMVRIDPDRVVTEGGEIPADLILFQPGMTGLPWFGDTDLPLSPGGMIRADALCRVEGCEGVWVAGDSGSYPGPEWLPKQAHQADLQAKAAAANIADALAGKAPSTPFTAELICIMDSLDKGMLVFRRGRINLILPALKPLHWLKRAFEHHYLRAYR
ncbi:sulfide:quinone oxidoreductase [Defluviimonas denitrificans]|jgi:sulfide:quinone oxidoreductase|uniref:Sulfide:quinone oxidoreductase n=1 Tax=Albidovulum denitrificans TaxID=404881 RepID=A0A2S8S9P2_9RHOB|nr:FAD-dependent oxidoreductase [Defluviimonas denitrificans]PQV57547.1 sulfide:quinone oxidoreductase [Defluviimonas denitrificans]